MPKNKKKSGRLSNGKSEKLDINFNSLSAEEKDLVRRKRKSVSKGQTRVAQALGGSSGPTETGVAPAYFIPQLENASLELPKHRQEILSWCDYYCQTNELVGAAIDIHASMAVSDIRISCSDPGIQKEYQEIYEEMGGVDLMYSIAHEFFRVGNCFPWGNWDEDEQRWTEFVLIPPVAIDLKKSILSSEPEILLSYSALTGSGGDTSGFNKTDESIDSLLAEHFKIDPSKVGQDIPLPTDSVSHIANKIISGTMWGVPPVFRCFKSLILYDKMYRSRAAILENLIIPLRIFQITDGAGAPVTEEVLESFREQLENAQNDANYHIITSGQVIDRQVGVAGRIQDYTRELEFIEDLIAAGLKINKALLHGEGPTYSNAQVYQQSMAIQYQVFRTRLTKWLRNKVFKKVAQARGYYEKDTTNDRSPLDVTKKNKRLQLPNILWQNDISFDDAVLSQISELYNGGLISKQTYMSYVAPNIDIDEERIKMSEEEKTESVLDVMQDGYDDEVDEMSDSNQPSSVLLDDNVER